MSQFKALAELEVPNNISKKIVNYETETVSYEFRSPNASLILFVSFIMTLIFSTMTIISLFLNETWEVKWKMFLTFFIFTLPFIIVYIVQLKTKKICSLDFKNRKINAVEKKFEKKRNYIFENIDNIKTIILDSKSGTWNTMEYRTVFVTNNGKHIYFSKRYSSWEYIKVWDYIKKIGEILELQSFQNDFITFTIKQFTKLSGSARTTANINILFEKQIEPFLDHMNLTQIILLVEAIEHRYQFNAKYATKATLKIIEKKFNDKIEREKYPIFFEKKQT